MNSKTKMRYTSNKGITLIALVITIIVLLILAGVTINMVLGDDGIIAQAKHASERYEESTDIENIGLAYTAVKKIAPYADGMERDIGVELAKIYDAGSVTVTQNPDGTYKIDIEKGSKTLEYSISSDGTVTKFDPIAEPTPGDNGTITFRVNCSCGNAYAYYEFTAYEGDTWGDWYENPELDHSGVTWENGGFYLDRYMEPIWTLNEEWVNVGYDDEIQAYLEDTPGSAYTIWHGDYGSHPGFGDF